MCGIVGFAGSGNECDLEKMTNALAHRGPDDQGTYVRGKYALGHRRLSIIDTSKNARQPMFDKNKDIGIIFNGEIYNFKQLKSKLQGTYGSEFKTESDTEVIINLYLEYGENCFEKLDGMFALAIFDFRTNKVILARDRFGEKPLYYAVCEDTLIFASELRSLTLHPKCKKQLDLSSVNEYLMYEYVPTPKSILKGVYKLEPATYLVYKDGEIQKKKFWDFPSAEVSDSFDNACKKVDQLLNQSVSDCLISDRPLGVFLSGGIDSSTIAYYASKNMSEKLKTFSVGFNESSFDESEYAKEVADYLKTDHYKHTVSAKDVQKWIPKIQNIIDEPLADASILPTYLLSKFTNEHVTVSLGGDGGDELFAGYSTFNAHKTGMAFSKLPEFVRDGIGSLAMSVAPVSSDNFNFRFKLQNFLSGFEDFDKLHMHQKWLGSFGQRERSKLFKSDCLNELEGTNVFSNLNMIAKDIDLDELNKILAIYMRTYMMDDILVKVDRSSMAVGLEVRSPFISHHVVDYVTSLPYEYKYKNGTTKRILKSIMKDKLPLSSTLRKKKGFGIPVSKWLREDLSSFLKEVLARDNINKIGLFNSDYVDELIDSHISRREDNGKKLWTLLIFQLWTESIMDNSSLKNKG